MIWDVIAPIMTSFLCFCGKDPRPSFCTCMASWVWDVTFQYMSPTTTACTSLARCETHYVNTQKRNWVLTHFKAQMFVKTSNKTSKLRVTGLCLVMVFKNSIRNVNGKIRTFKIIVASTGANELNTENIVKGRSTGMTSHISLQIWRKIVFCVSTSAWLSC